MRAACTIVAPNYLPFARTLAGSYLAQHPGQRFFVLIVADVADPKVFHVEHSFFPVLLADIGVPNLRATAMRYDLLELNTNVKPTFLKYLLRTYSLEALVYLDPDIFVYRPLETVFDLLSTGATAVLTPHMTSPVFDGKLPSEQDLLYNGTYNLGFIGVGPGQESCRLLDWWETRCLELGFSEGRTGLFVDQKWMNLAPGLFDRVAVCRDPGLNVAYWNLHERYLAEAATGVQVTTARQAPVPLRFFHFSGFDPSQPEMLSRNTNRFTLADRPDLQPLFRRYAEAVAGHRGKATDVLPYGFDRFSDGVTVTRLARRIFAAHEAHFLQAGADPFAADGGFARFARTIGLVKGTLLAGKATWQEFNPVDRRVKAVHRLLRIALRVLGPHRYELLMRYLAHITVLRHQAAFLRDPRWPKTVDRP